MQIETSLKRKLVGLALLTLASFGIGLGCGYKLAIEELDDLSVAAIASQESNK